MSPEQVTIVPFQTQNEAFNVNGEQQQYLVQRIDGLTNGVCCGSNPQQDDLQTPYDGENAVEPCKTFDVCNACRHTFTCECVDFTKGNDCKHILLGDHCRNNGRIKITMTYSGLRVEVVEPGSNTCWWGSI